MDTASTPTAFPEAPAGETRGTATGMLLVAGSAIVWSFGGSIARFLTVSDPWTVVFWRSVSACVFLLGFMILRDGLAGSRDLFRRMGWPGIAVGLCFATASSSFVVALQFTTVANILLMGAGVPLIAGLIGWLIFREPVAPATWLAIGTVLCGVAVMVSDSLQGNVSPIGDGLAVLIALAFACATVITRRYSSLRMTPAVCFGTFASGLVSAGLAGGYAVGAVDAGLLLLFGALNLGLGLALFVTGVRLVPSAVAALIGTMETVLGPVWVWAIHGEVPAPRTVYGGLMVFAALVAHILWQIRAHRRVRLVAPAR